jgi:hypothetical protein
LAPFQLILEIFGGMFVIFDLEGSNAFQKAFEKKRNNYPIQLLIKIL